MNRLIVDAHEDLAWNMLTYGRDYTQPVAETRRRESGNSTILDNNGDTTLSWQEYQRGRVAVVFSTLFAAPARGQTSPYETQVYANSAEAYKIYSGQLDAYQRLFDQHPDKFTPVLSTRQLEAVLEKWRQPDVSAPTGLVPLMEGADGVRAVDELAEWWERGVRIIGPAWMRTRYCGGTREPGPLTKEGHALLEVMAEIGFSLDLSHMAWEAALEALDLYPGTILASHANALKRVKNGTSNRFLTDEIISGLIQRGGVIGVVPFNRFLIQDWKNSDPRSDCPLTLVADQIDYICQKAGNALHVGLGTDFDGGFGLQHIPPELDTIADLHKLTPLLAARGYTEAEINAIFGGNWLEILQRSLPA